MNAVRQGYTYAEAPNSGALAVVKAGLIRPALEYASLAGADARTLLRGAHLPSDLMSHPNHFVPAAGWFDLFSNLVEESGSPDLGWRVAESRGLRAYSSEFMAGICNAPTLLEAWRFVARAQAQHCNCQFFRMRVLGNFGYVLQGDTFRYPGFEQRNAFRTANIITATRAFLGDDWKPDLIVTQTPLDMLPASSLEGVRVVRRQHYSAVRIPRKLLVAQSRRELQGGYAGGGSPPQDTSDQIREVLKSYPRTEMPRASELADLMNISERSLQRRLQERHTSYQQLLREISFEHARERLEDTSLKVIDIAQELGYEDSSHFSRMFRSMSGVSPSEYRRLISQGEPRRA